MRMHSKASKNHSRFEVKRIKNGSLWRKVLNICSLVNMSGKHSSDEEKMPIKVICEQSGRGKATIMRVLAAVKELPNNTVPKCKPAKMPMINERMKKQCLALVKKHAHWTTEQ